MPNPSPPTRKTRCQEAHFLCTMTPKPHSSPKNEKCDHLVVFFVAEASPPRYAPENEKCDAMVMFFVPVGSPFPQTQKKHPGRVFFMFNGFPTSQTTPNMEIHAHWHVFSCWITIPIPPNALWGIFRILHLVSVFFLQPNYHHDDLLFRCFALLLTIVWFLNGHLLFFLHCLENHWNKLEAKLRFSRKIS